MSAQFRNKNRGYQQLRVRNDAVDFFVATCRTFRKFPYDLRRLASQAIASADSVHRNIAEGYCRRSVRESVSGLEAYRKAELLGEPEYAPLNGLAYKIENELLKLVESLERKALAGDWIDHLLPTDTVAASAPSAVKPVRVHA